MWDARRTDGATKTVDTAAGIQTSRRTQETRSRLLIVSNRLPVSARIVADGVGMVPSCGGLATGLRCWHERSDALWIGWPGDVSGVPAIQRDEFDQQLHERSLVPVHLSGDQVARHYAGFANRALWPLFHYLIDRVSLNPSEWDAYRDVNEAFADAVMQQYRTNDTIWVHDYHLMLLPGLLRTRLPHARIGFFLHIPFPSADVFRVLPWRRDILKGLLGADLVGFHTFAYMRHFMGSLSQVEDVGVEMNYVHTDRREVKVAVFPMGVDAAAFSDRAADPAVRVQAAAIRRDAGARRIVLSIDRLDYTKGITQRLNAIQHVLERNPALRDGVRYIQVVVPSRGDVREYQQFRRQVDERVGEINGVYGNISSVPVHYLHQPVTTADLVALYCAADVMLVTPVRDGMNLVAKEFVASRIDTDGVLVLSEFAGAAEELNGAVTVNPYDVEQMADSIQRALSMRVEERFGRMRTLRQHVREHDVYAWADAFVRELDVLRPCEDFGKVARPQPSLLTELSEAQRARAVRLLLDYDGTLVPLARSPELAAPDDELLRLLERVAASPHMRVDVVSGRSRATLEDWLGDLPVSLWAEHGLWHRERPGDSWEAAMTPASDPLKRVRPILEQFAANTPGSRVEVKCASLAWHYRAASRELGARHAHDLRMLLGDTLIDQPLEVLEGKKVIEVRLRGISKALVAQRLKADIDRGTLMIAIGDDRTDEELFRALPPSSLTVAVGRRWTAARFRVDDYAAVRTILRFLLTESDVVFNSREEDEQLVQRLSA